MGHLTRSEDIFGCYDQGELLASGGGRPEMPKNGDTEMHRTAPTTKSHMTPNVSGAKAAKRSCRRKSPEVGTQVQTGV